jgi:hypothetical protein
MKHSNGKKTQKILASSADARFGKSLRVACAEVKKQTDQCTRNNRKIITDEIAFGMK